MKRVLLAGATGYLGSYIAKELLKRSCFSRIIIRNPVKLEEKNIEASEVVQAEITSRDSITGCCTGIDVVISAVGITRQKDGLTYMDVDYQANMNLLEEAIRNGVEKFIYVSVLNGDKLTDLKMCEAKEKFADRLRKSGLDYCIVRPNGFFSDMEEFFHMAQRGRVYLFGNGNLKANPIHGEDLAAFCVDAIDKPDQDVEIGGPQTLSQNEIATMAFEAVGKTPRITYIPEWLRLTLLKAVRTLTRSKIYGPIEFFMTVMAIDMLAPEYGQHTLKEYFTTLNNSTE